MESLDDKIKDFLKVSSGYGSGDGSGYGSGYGDGYGYGYGDGYGSGSGDGDGDGDGVTMVNGNKVYMIDGIATIIYSIHNNIAKGDILRKDLTFAKCYIAKVGDYFAHGDSAKDAVTEATNKYQSNLSEGERLQLFVDSHANYNGKYKASDLFVWHNTLTGSCRFGRESFCSEREINIDTDQFTIAEFIELTEDSYGGDIINKLKDCYGVR